MDDKIALIENKILELNNLINQFKFENEKLDKKRKEKSIIRSIIKIK